MSYTLADYKTNVSKVSYYDNITEDALSSVTKGWNTSIDSSYQWQGFQDGGMNFGDLYSLTSRVNVDWYGILSLPQQACWDNGIQNCTSVCTDPSLLFVNGTSQGSKTAVEHELRLNATYNILACMYYPLLSQLLVENALAKDQQDQIAKLADDYKIVKNASLDLLNTILIVQQNCYTDYCVLTSDDNACEGFSTDDATYQAYTGYGQVGLFPDWSTISPESTMGINPDIGGIGVSISYMIQFSMIICAWVLLRLLRMKPFITASVRERRLKHARHHSKYTECEGQDSQGTMRGLPSEELGPVHNYREMLDKLLDDFQKAQCFFLIALNIAILLGLLKDAKILGFKSLGQWVRNMSYIQCVTQGGVVFVTSTLYFIKTAKSRKATVHHGEACPPSGTEHGADHAVTEIWWRIPYVDIFSVIACALGTAAWVRSYDFAEPEHRIDTVIGTEHSFWVNSCGSVSPATYNGEKWDGPSWTHKNNKKDRIPIIILCWILIAWILVDRIRPHLHTRIGWLAVAYKHPRFPWIRRITLVIVDALVLTCLGIFARDYTNTMRPSLPTIDKNFTLGQLLAIFVWCGTIMDAGNSLKSILFFRSLDAKGHFAHHGHAGANYNVNGDTSYQGKAGTEEYPMVHVQSR